MDRLRDALSSARPNESSVGSVVYDTKEDASFHIAQYIASRINNHDFTNRPFVLGLATGSTPIPIYKHLVALYQKSLVSFENVISINLDEYFPIQPEDINSYHYFMNENLFKFVNFKKENNFIPNGTVPSENSDQHCNEYENIIHKYGIDIQILGIGRSGHIGFNEPGSTRDTKTRVVSLHQQTVVDAGPSFEGEENVPKNAITMGIDSIFQARECILCAWGKSKSEIINQAIQSKPTADLPASFLHLHPHCVFVLDKEASGN